MTHSQHVRKLPSDRKGVAVSELAICLPILLLLTLAVIETCSMIYLKQSLSIAAYEGARVAMIPGTTSQNVDAQCQQILDDRRIKGARISVSPSVASAASGTFIAVDITAPCDSNSPLVTMFFKGQNVASHVEMMKEI